MPVTPTYPGVYIEELPSAVRAITGVATSITAFVGYTTSGPVDKAVPIFSFADYQRTFGGLQLDSELGYAVQQFFHNGGNNAIVVRVAQGAAPAQIVLGDIGSTPVLALSATGAGAWGNAVSIDVDYMSANPDSLFNFTITSYARQNGKLVVLLKENYRNLSMNPLQSTYAPVAVNGDSQLITITDQNAAVAVPGWALSKDLSTFPALTTQDTTISGVLDTTTPFTLTLAMSPPSTTIADLLTKVKSAIGTAGLTGKLTVAQSGATGQGSGNYLLLTSGTPGASSSVQILGTQAGDVSAKIGLGLVNGGREKEAASTRRPAPNGTLSSDLAGTLPAVATVDVIVTDRSSNTQLVKATGLAVGSPTTLTGLRNALQTTLRGIPNSPATAQATVQVAGTFLSAIGSAATPNASINFSVASLNAAENVQEYSLGTGATFNAQTGGSAGSDGSAPGASQIIGDYGAKTGIYALRNVDLFNLLCIPRTTQLPASEALTTLSHAMSFCEQRRAFLIVDPDPLKDATTIGDWTGTQLQTSSNAAVFFPRILVADPLQNFRTRPMPASGAIAGVFSRTDAQRGVWKAPAGIDAAIQGAQGLSVTLTDPENGALNPLGINCLRTFPVYGSVVWGSRTLFGSDARADQFKYIPVRRLALFLEESLLRGTQWVVFEPNDEPLWAQIRLNITSFMQNLFRQGAFQGTTPREAYFVKCDRETTTSTDQNLGVVNIVVGFAPLRPAEFVVIQLQQMAGQKTA